MSKIFGENRLYLFKAKPVEQTTTSTESTEKPQNETSETVEKQEVVDDKQVVDKTAEKEITTETKEVSETFEDTADKPETPQAPEFTDELLLSYLKDKHGKEVASVEDLFKAAEPKTQDDPYKNLSEETKQFLKYNLETGRGYQDYVALNKDYSKASPLDIAREKAIEQSGGKLSKEDVDEYLERRLNISITDDMDKFDLIDLESYVHDYKNKKIQDQKTYLQPIKKEGTQEETVTLENGQKMLKKDYDNAIQQRQTYLDAIKATSDKIKGAEIKVEIDDNGEKKTLDVGYEYSKNEVHQMASLASEPENLFVHLFANDKGEIDHGKLQEGLFWANESNRVKAISAILHKAIAEQTEQLMKEELNIKTETKRMPSDGSSSKRVSLKDLDNKGGYGLRKEFLTK